MTPTAHTMPLHPSREAHEHPRSWAFAFPEAAWIRC